MPSVTIRINPALATDSHTGLFSSAGAPAILYFFFSDPIPCRTDHLKPPSCQASGSKLAATGDELILQPLDNRRVHLADPTFRKIESGPDFLHG